jgi:hypothetical protein
MHERSQANHDRETCVSERNRDKKLGHLSLDEVGILYMHGL